MGGARPTRAMARELMTILVAGLCTASAIACKGGGKAPAGGGKGTGAVAAPDRALDAAVASPPTVDAAPAPAAAAGSLRGKVALGFAVSSQVDNPSKTPGDLVDGSLDTAWNSRTGQLVGAWMAVRVPAEARVTALRMTVGATGPGAAGTDPFTMNHWISRVRVSRNGEPLGDLDLDPELRTPQDLALGPPGGLPGGDFKIEVLATIPGSKKFWREICVSELDVIGTAPPATGDHPPTVAIGSLDAAPAEDDALPLVPMAAVASMQEVCDRTKVEGACAPAEYDPAFPSLGVPPPPAVPGWTRASFVGRDLDVYDCHLVVEAGGAVYATRLADDCAAPLGDQVAATLVDLIPGDPPELMLRLRHQIRPPAGAPPPVLKPPDLSYETVRFCGATASGAPGCTEPWVIAGISEDTVGDDPEPVATIVWDLRVSIAGGAVVVKAGRGEPSLDYPEADEPGRYRVRR